MDATRGNGGSVGGGSGQGMRASDAERDATVERLSQATGEGRLTLDEFSQRMGQASTARTRAEAGPPGDRSARERRPGRAGRRRRYPQRAVLARHAGGGLNVFGPWRMGLHVIVLSLVGGARLDLSQAELAAPDVTLTKVSLVGGVRARIPAESGWTPPG